MTKNEVCAGRQTIRVFGPDGSEIGSTYPKRAAGLVKKGRACYVNDFTIRLNMSDTIQNSEVIKMDNNMNIETGNKQEENKVFKLYFNARDWKFNRDCGQNVGGRSFMEGPDGGLAEAYMIGDWQYNWTEIVSETLMLPKFTDCSLTFWLNGGENDRNDEVCRFEVILNNDYEQRYTYNLNRNYIQPLKKLNGWELYEIPFQTRDNEYTQLKFVAQRAYMTVMTAKDASEYAQFEDNPDPFESERPQRHNLIFDDGFPKNRWYSTDALRKKHGFAKDGETFKENGTGCSIVFGGDDSAQMKEIWKKMDDVTEACESIGNFDAEEFIGRLRSSLLEALSDRDDVEDVDELVDRVADEVQDALADSVDDIRDALEELSDQMEELKDNLLEEE